MKLSDYVINFLRDEYGVDTIFTLCGAGCMHLLDSLGTAEGVNFVANHHEQASALAAEGYARINNKLGACIVTSGPGGTNALTGTLCSWLDSIPVIVVSGQVNKSMSTNFIGLNLRQLGDQEFNIVDTVQNMTKYAVQVNNPEDIRFHLEKACYLATNGRPGPVWLDIPLDVQTAKIEPENLKGFTPPTKPVISQKIIEEVVDKINNAKRPLFVLGNGIRLSGGVQELHNLLKKTNIPVITAVNGNDLVNENYRAYYGRFGTHAQFCANKLLNECDLLVSVGSRLYVRQTGYNFKNFAKNAYKIVLDIDETELRKPTIFPDMPVVGDAKEFLQKLNNESISPATDEWLKHCDSFRQPQVLDRHRNMTGVASVYALIEKLNNHLPADYHIVTSDGSANVVTMQVSKLKDGQRLITNTGGAPLGYGLPCAVGAATHHKIVCIEGDGSLHLNVHELQTVRHNNLPIKILLINNDGYLSMKITQNIFFNGRLVAAEKSSGVTFPDYKKVADVYDIPFIRAHNNDEIDEALEAFFKIDGPAICEVMTHPDEVHEPKVIARLDENGNFIPGLLENISWSENW
jgi:acetolactate synthase-1/2/3 large subunit